MGIRELLTREGYLFRNRVPFGVLFISGRVFTSGKGIPHVLLGGRGSVVCFK